VVSGPFVPTALPDSTVHTMSVDELPGKIDEVATRKAFRSGSRSCGSAIRLFVSPIDRRSTVSEYALISSAVIVPAAISLAVIEFASMSGPSIPSTTMLATSETVVESLPAVSYAVKRKNSSSPTPQLSCASSPVTMTALPGSKISPTRVKGPDADSDISTWIEAKRAGMGLPAESSPSHSTFTVDRRLDRIGSEGFGMPVVGHAITWETSALYSPIRPPRPMAATAK
jgi:hypothetical protein